MVESLEEFKAIEKKGEVVEADPPVLDLTVDDDSESDRDSLMKDFDT